MSLDYTLYGLSVIFAIVVLVAVIGRIFLMSGIEFHILVDKDNPGFAACFIVGTINIVALAILLFFGGFILLLANEIGSWLSWKQA